MSSRADIVDTLNRLMSERGLKAGALSTAAGLNHTAVKDFLSGKAKSLKVDSLVALARALQVSAAVFFDRGEPVRIVGHVMSEDLVADDEPGAAGPEWVCGLAPVSGEEFAALDVATSTLAPVAHAGAVLIFENRQARPDPADDGHICVCVVDGGERMVKVLRFDQDGKPWLAPLAPHLSPIRDREIVSADRVRVILPADVVERRPNSSAPANGLDRDDNSGGPADSDQP